MAVGIFDNVLPEFEAFWQDDGRWSLTNRRERSSRRNSKLI